MEKNGGNNNSPNKNITLTFTPTMGEFLMNNAEVHDLATDLKERFFSRKYKNRIAVTPPDFYSDSEQSQKINSLWKIPDINRVLKECPEINLKAAGVLKKFEVYDKCVQNDKIVQKSAVKNLQKSHNIDNVPKVHKPTEPTISKTITNVIAINKFKKLSLEKQLEEIDEEDYLGNSDSAEANSKKSSNKSESSGSNRNSCEEADEEGSSSNNEEGSFGDSEDEIEAILLECSNFGQNLDAEEAAESDSDGDDDGDAEEYEQMQMNNREAMNRDAKEEEAMIDKGMNEDCYVNIMQGLHDWKIGGFDKIQDDCANSIIPITNKNNNNINLRSPSKSKFKSKRINNIVNLAVQAFTKPVFLKNVFEVEESEEERITRTLDTNDNENNQIKLNLENIDIETENRECLNGGYCDVQVETKEDEEDDEKMQTLQNLDFDLNLDDIDEEIANEIMIEATIEAEREENDNQDNGGGGSDQDNDDPDNMEKENFLHENIDPGNIFTSNNIEDDESSSGGGSSSDNSNAEESTVLIMRN